MHGTRYGAASTAAAKAATTNKDYTHRAAKAENGQVGKEAATATVGSSHEKSKDSTRSITNKTSIANSNEESHPLTLDRAPFV
jgi:hypothetical protein